MEISKNCIFDIVLDFLCQLGYRCELSEVIKMIYINKTPEALGRIDILSNKTMPVITIEHYPNDSNWTLKKELIDQLNTSFTLKKLETTEITCGMFSISRERFEILGLKNNCRFSSKETDYE